MITDKDGNVMAFFLPRPASCVMVVSESPVVLTRLVLELSTAIAAFAEVK